MTGTVRQGTKKRKRIDLTKVGQAEITLCRRSYRVC